MKKVIFVFASFTLSLTVGAQELGDIIKGGVQDVNYLLDGYMNPLLKSFGYGFSEGWYNTAAPHKIGGVDFTISPSVIFIPDDEKTFFVDNSKLTEIKRLNSSGVEESGPIQTIFGSDQTTEFYSQSADVNVEFPGGLINLEDEIGFNAMVGPTFQLGVGLPKGTDLKIRLFPQNEFGDNDELSVKIFGLGVLHDVKQWIPGLRVMPFDLSGFVGFTKMNVTYALDEPDASGLFTFESGATTIQGVISKKLAVLTVYAGLGANFSNTELSMDGNFDTDGDPNTTLENIKISLDAPSSGARATVGMRLKLAILTIHGAYTLAGYNSLNLGVGLSVR